MMQVQFSLAVPQGYSSPFVEIHSGEFEQPVTLAPGLNVARGEPFDIGLLHIAGRRKLRCHIEFGYIYDEEAGVVTVCGTDFRSRDGFRLVVELEGSPVDESYYCFTQDLDGRLQHDPHWGHPIRLLKDLPEFWTGIARSANEALIAELRKSITVYERARAPEVPDSAYNSFLSIGFGDSFVEPYLEGRTLAEGESLYTIESTFGGTTLWTKDDDFSNVIGSSGDPKIKGESWLRVWEEKCDKWPDECTSHNYPKGYKCDPCLVGGHVIAGTVSKKVDPGENGVVHIVPICRVHNNNSVAMKVRRESVKVIILNNYLKTWPV